MIEKVFCYITQKREVKKKNFKNLIKFYKSCIPNDIKFYILDLSNITKDRTKYKFVNINSKINYVKIDTIRQLNIFLKNKKLLVAGFDGMDFISIKIHFLLSKYDVKRLFISDLGYIPSEIGNESYSLKEKSNIFFNLKIPYYFFRILCLFGFVKNIEFFFESSQNRINQIFNSFSKKLSEKIGIDFSYYRNIFRINSKVFDQTLNKKVKKNIIVYCDSGFDHPDKIFREGKTNKANREKYYLYLYYLLKKLKEIYSQKIFFIKHPKNPYPKDGNFLKIKKSFKIKNANAEKYIFNASLTVFHVSTLITRAMQLNKKIILIKSPLVGNYLHLRSLNWIKKTKLYNLKLANNYNLNKKFNKSLLNKIKLYNKFLKVNSFVDINSKRSQQIKKILEKKF